MVSNASDDLPEPDRPVNTTRALRGRSSVMFFRLCSRAPWMTSRSMPTEPFYGGGVTKLTRPSGHRQANRVTPAASPYVWRRRYGDDMEGETSRAAEGP